MTVLVGDLQTTAKVNLDSSHYSSITINGFAQGTTTTLNPAIVWIQNTDQVCSANALSGLYVRQSFGGGAMQGNRNGVYSFVSLVMPPASTDTSSKNYVSGLFEGYLDASPNPLAAGGASFSGYNGGLWGINPNVYLSGNAKNVYGIYGSEIDVSVHAGATVAEKFGLIIVQGAPDVSQGTLDDAAIHIGNQDGAGTGWRYGIEFGGTSKQWAFTPTSTLIGATIRSQPSKGTAVAKHGVDFRNVAFGGCAFASSGFSVDASGNLTLNGAAKRNYADDAAAAAGGVPIYGVYHSGGIMRIRLQ